MGSIAENYLQVRHRVHQALEASGRQGATITLVAVTKTMGISVIHEALAANLRHFGENRVEEAEEKIPEVDDGAFWHLIGPLQKKKAKLATALFDVIHSVDGIDLAQRLARCATQREKSLDVLLQVNLSGDKSRYGMPSADVPRVAQAVDTMERLRLRGLMTMPPYSLDLNQTRVIYQKLRAIRDELQQTHQFHFPLADLSMGMTNDFEVAIEEGATMVRIGRALFGERTS